MFLANDIPNINKFGAAKWPNIKEFRGPRGSQGGGSNLANSPEFFYIYGFFFASYNKMSENSKGA